MTHLRLIFPLFLLVFSLSAAAQDEDPALARLHAFEADTRSHIEGMERLFGELEALQRRYKKDGTPAVADQRLRLRGDLGAAKLDLDQRLKDLKGMKKNIYMSQALSVLSGGASAGDVAGLASRVESFSREISDYKQTYGERYQSEEEVFRSTRKAEEDRRRLLYVALPVAVLLLLGLGVALWRLKRRRPSSPAIPQGAITVDPATGPGPEDGA